MGLSPSTSNTQTLHPCMNQQPATLDGQNRPHSSSLPSILPAAALGSVGLRDKDGQPSPSPQHRCLALLETSSTSASARQQLPPGGFHQHFSSGFFFFVWFLFIYLFIYEQEMPIFILLHGLNALQTTGNVKTFLQRSAGEQQPPIKCCSILILFFFFALDMGLADLHFVTHSYHCTCKGIS